MQLTDEPPSPNQQALWLRHLAAPADAGYHLPAAARLTGPLDVPALRAAFQLLVARHEALRAVFPVGTAGPALALAPPETLDFEVLDGSAWGAEAEARLAALADAPFDLMAAPAFRVRVTRLADDRHVLLVVAHHIVADTWSLSVLLRELLAIYPALAAGAAPPALAAAPSLVASLRERRERLAGPPGDRLAAWWREQLAGLAEAPIFPHAPGPAGGDAGGAIRTRVPPDLLTQVASIAAATGATTFAALLAALHALLARWAGRPDPTIGVPLADRGRAREAGLVGYLANLAPLRLAVGPEDSFRLLVGRADAAIRGAQAHQAYPHAWMNDRLAPGRGPLVEVAFSLQPAPSGGAPIAGFVAGELGDVFALGDVTLRPLPLPMRNATFKLALEAAHDAGGLAIRWRFDADFFDPAMVAALADQFEVLLREAVTAPDVAVGRLPLLTHAVREDALHRWNPAPTPPPADVLHGLFARSAATTPDAVAVIAEGRGWTYAELDAAARALAADLQAAGIGPGARVAVLASPDAGRLIAELGVLVAGAAFVPFDPTLPDARLADLAADAGCDAIVPTAATADRAAGLAPCLVLADRQARTPATLAPPPVGPEALAYVIYTSGSTGRPKGVMTTHGAASNTLIDVNRRFGVGPADRVLAVSSPGFDLSIFDAFGLWAAGGAVVMPDAARAADPGHWVDLIERDGATVWNSAPALLELLVDAAEQRGASLASLRLVMVSGDRLPPALPARLWALAPGARVVNLGGATEGAIWSICHELTPDAPPYRRVPYGRALAGQRIYVLDAAGEPCPIGVPGEIHIGGHGVARGYHGRPELTDERFVADLFGPGRLYRTGDRGRYLPDGTVDLLGRLDEQLKVGGVRIEPAEIEAVLRAHPAVTGACVIGRAPPGRGTRLAAYVTGDDALDLADLRAWTMRRLPRVMWPADLVTVAAFPLTPNGKLDRGALPAPPVAPSTGLPPRGPSQLRVATAWAEILGAFPGRDDDFFAAGGDSLAALRLATRLAALQGHPVPADFVYRHPTVAGLAAELEAPDDGADTPWIADAVLPPDVVPTPSAGGPDAFVTGATGFLGAYLLAELAQAITGRLWCLVRAADAVEGLARIAANLDRYGLWDATLAARVVPVPGDLGQPRFGLAPAAHAALAAAVGDVYHAGAEVNLVRPYADLRPANVAGTVEALRLAAASGARFHHVSSLAAIGGDGPSAGSYAHSKWAAEGLVEAAAARGLVVALYRPGEIVGALTASRSNPRDLFGGLVRASLWLGMLPALDVRIHTVPVDAVARAIVHGAPPSAGEMATRQLAAEVPVTPATLAASLADLGRPLALVPYARWRAALLAAKNLPRELAAIAAVVGAHEEPAAWKTQAAPLAPSGSSPLAAGPALDAPALRHYLTEWDRFDTPATRV